LTSVLANGSARRAEDVLAEHGFTGERLLKLSRKIANDELRRRGAFLDESRFEDLVGFLALQGVRAAVRYDPERPQASYGRDGGDPFASWMADILAHRLTDWYRSKGEGHGDRRRNLDNRIVLSAMDDEYEVDADFDFESLVSERRLGEWQNAARAVDLAFADWVVITLDRAAKVIKLHAYSTPKRPETAPPSHAEQLPETTRKPA
jgi:hypothetical protein